MWENQRIGGCEGKKNPKTKNTKSLSELLSKKELALDNLVNSHGSQIIKNAKIRVKLKL